MLLWHCHNKATVYFHPFIMTKNNPMQFEGVIVVYCQVIHFSALWREHVTFWWDADEVCFVVDHHPQLDFYSASSLKQQSIGRHVAPLGHIVL